MFALCAVMVSACEPHNTDDAVATSASDLAAAIQVKPPLDDPRAVRGGVLYVRHCQQCHGANGAGAANWRKMDAEGFYPAPPLDGTGHAWHHSTITLRDFILHGSPPGQGRMPAWNEKLSEQEVSDLIIWMESLWPDELFASWLRMENATRE